MKTLVLFDSNLGNTKKIAETIAGELGNGAEVKSIADFDKQQLNSIDFLIVGSPIIGWKPTEKMRGFLNGFKVGELNGKKATTFDTRVKLFIHGDAKEKLAKKLESLGAEIFTESQAFYVKGKQASLLEGEIERAKEWAQVIKSKIV
jgi:flavodoxin